MRNAAAVSFKPPVCARTPDGLFVIDGQHTAIAAAGHPGIGAVPVLVIEDDAVERRASAFVSHNRDRLRMSELEIFTAEVAAGVPAAASILAAVRGAGGDVPRSMPAKGRARPGQVVAVTAVQRVHASHGPTHLARVVRIARASGVAPVNSTVVYGLHMLLTDPAHARAGALPEATIARALASLGDVNVAAQRHGSATEVNRYRACADLLARAALGEAGRPAPPEPTRPIRISRSDPDEVPRWARWSKTPAGRRGSRRA